MTVRLTLVCHGMTAATAAAVFPAGEPLTERGLREATTATAALAGTAERITAWCSPAPAAVQTAAALGLRAQTDPGLRDCDFGRWRGRPLADVHAAEPDEVGVWMSDPAAAPHGGESVLDLIDRTAGWLAGCLHHVGRASAVTHAAVIRAAVLHVLDAPAASFWRVDVPPLATVRLTGRGGRWQLLAAV
jgi:broad specificity phosphatase PhoE